MHYKNKREAKDGDQVIGKGWNGSVTVGRVSELSSTSTSCNALVTPVFGEPRCVTIGEFYHAEDAFAAIEAAQPQPEPQAAAESTGTQTA